LIGSSILFLISARYGQSLVLKFGKYIHLNEGSLKAVERQFKKYGSWVIIFGRLLLWFRVPITVFAGISGISYKKFFICTLISAIIWIPIFLYLGQHLGIQTIQVFTHHPWYSILSSLIVILTITLIFRTFNKNAH
jgi:membrane protein DedA with SNARE-associated domain